MAELLKRVGLVRRNFFRALALSGVIAGCGLLNSASGQPSMITILTNGPSSNRLNIVFLSEGYTSNQLGQFLVDATNTINALLSAQPFQEYKNHFNAFAIEIASAESGSDHPNNLIFSDTYFNSTYDPYSDLLITIPPNFADTNYSDGQGRVDALLQTFMPNCQLPVLLVNDTTLGGSDNSGTAAIVSTASGSTVFAIHESGHVLANLGDEYTTENPGYPDTEEPNTTQQTNYDSIKWKAWIDTNNTPLPTPATSAYQNSVGAFEGAHYHATGWYRPQLNCAMGNFSSPFCSVCSEALVLAIYQHVRPVDFFFPASAEIIASNSEVLTFSVAILQPTSHSLAVQWLTNGIPIEGATNLNFVVSADLLNPETNCVCARITDSTPLVRSDPSSLLLQMVKWEVKINNRQLFLDSLSKLLDGRFSFRIAGSAPQGCVVETSTDLVTWSSFATSELSNGEALFTNASQMNVGQQFFRAYAP
jgi:hypothetical protein